MMRRLYDDDTFPIYVYTHSHDGMLHTALCILPLFHNAFCSTVLYATESSLRNKLGYFSITCMRVIPVYCRRMHMCTLYFVLLVGSSHTPCLKQSTRFIYQSSSSSLSSSLSLSCCTACNRFCKRLSKPFTSELVSVFLGGSAGAASIS